MANRLPLGARTRLLFLGSAFLVLVVGLLVPWVRTEDVVRAYQGRSIEKALQIFDAGGDLGEAQVIVLAKEDPQYEVIRQRLAQRQGVGTIRIIRTEIGEPRAQRYVIRDDQVLKVDVPGIFGDALLLESRAWFVASGFLVFFLMFAAFHRTLEKLVLSPVYGLLSSAKSLEEGRPGARFSCSSGDEFESLAETLNRIVERSERAREDLRTMNEALDLRVDELRDLNAGLDEANRLKSEFLANVSHELRTPLGLIIGHADAMHSAFSTEHQTESVHRSLQHIIESGHDLRQLIEELLALAKVEAGRIELHPVPLQLTDLAAGLERAFSTSLASKGLALQVEVAECPIIESDHAKVRQVLYNFLANAIKYAPESGTLHLQAGVVDSGHAEIRVIDHGPGVPEDLRQVIFEKFRQGDSGLARGHGGTGLGLAIARQFADILRGTVRCEGTPGGGATFVLRLPLTWTREVDRPLLPESAS
ncbi:MAG: hypothetical protein CMJ28_04920 [Phycisphaerae bacterium]|nr:hypothetical protein [Phycisphaerae bacterium]